MAGMMSTNALFPFMIKGVVVDCDSTMNMGLYYTDSTSVGSPFLGYSDLVVFNFMSIATWTAQLMFKTGESHFFFRATGGDSFKNVPWNKVTGVSV